MNIRVNKVRQAQNMTMTEFWVAVAGSVVGAVTGGAFAALVAAYQLRKSLQSSLIMAEHAIDAERTLRRESAAQAAVHDLQRAVHNTMSTLIRLGYPHDDPMAYLRSIDGIVHENTRLLSEVHRIVWTNAHLLGPAIVGEFYDLLERHQRWERRALIDLAPGWETRITSVVALRKAEEFREEAAWLGGQFRNFTARAISVGWGDADVTSSLARWDTPEGSATAEGVVNPPDPPPT